MTIQAWLKTSEAPDGLLTVRRIRWTDSEPATDEEPVPVPRIRAWGAAVEASRSAKPQRRRRLPRPIHRLIGGISVMTLVFAAMGLCVVLLGLCLTGIVVLAIKGGTS